MDERSEKFDELLNGLDDMKTTVEELADDPPPGAEPNGLKKLEGAIDRARDIADDLDDHSE